MQKEAFTLIELLVVVLIISILAAVAVPQYQKVVLKAKMMEALTIGRSVMKAQQAYFLANGEYTSNMSKLDIDIPWNSVTATYHGMFDGKSDDVGPRLNINNLSTQGWAWDFRFATNEIMCYAPDSKPLIQQTCQSITQDNAPISYTEGGQSYKYYVMK